ncbi:extracellular solute-binding protein [Paenibacillus sacheonensis]|uniref:Extracellular solute-binding protein n=1 Tax=Paenibacillus sacheonensis TaxID=742054 RepID=A0A7X5BZB6_9BACL|nr:extracellular solute-binding protein [Paenibacillus sacheonensis]MBM7566107.1 putative aldouronate transport system substrate-binding protein [Paenibacillus sacheonensis]NBC70321.1 extracellular solute-binding protein [Paenibacillus sacheonensis]
MKKSRVGLAAAAASLLILAACSNSNNNAGGNEANDNAEKPANTASATTGNDKAATGNTANKPAEKPDPFGKYAEPLEVSVIYDRNPESEKSFIPESSYESNWNTDFWLDKLNIKPVVKWSAPSGDQYNQKYNLMFASNDLPDIFLLKSTDNKQSARSMLKKLVDADMVEDLTDAYSQYASDEVKDYYNTFDNKALDYATFDGKMYGLPSQGDTYANVQILWVRQDWLDKLSLQAPRTIDDLVTVAIAFKEKDPDGNGKPDTIGLALQNQFMDPGFTDAVSIFNAFNAYPKSWVKDSSGQLVWGGIQDTNKKPLEVLAGMYKEGLLDSEFALSDGNKEAEFITSGKAGMQIGSWWNGSYPLTFNIDNDPKADWKAYTLSTDNKIHAIMNFPTDQFLVVKKGFKNPEAAVKILNLSTSISHSKFQETIDRRNELNTKFGTDKVDAPTIIPNFGIGYLDTTLRSVKLFEDIFAGKASVDDLTVGEKQIFENSLKPNHDNPRKDAGKYKDYINWMSALSAIAHSDLDIQWNGFSGTTPTYDAKMGSLIDKQLTVFTKIIMNKEPVDYFDTFVKEWKAQGGDTITKEVNEAAAKESGN